MRNDAEATVAAAAAGIADRALVAGRSAQHIGAPMLARQWQSPPLTLQ